MGSPTAAHTLLACDSTPRQSSLDTEEKNGVSPNPLYVGGERKCIGPNPLKELRIGAVSEQGSWHRFSHVILSARWHRKGWQQSGWMAGKIEIFANSEATPYFVFHAHRGCLLLHPSFLSPSPEWAIEKNCGIFYFMLFFVVGPATISFYDPGRGRGRAFSSFFREFAT